VTELERALDNLARSMASGCSRRDALRLAIAFAGAAITSTLPVRVAADDAGGGNNACAHFCNALPDALVGPCVSAASHGTGPCFQCGPKSVPAGQPFEGFCGTFPNLVCCGPGQTCCNGVCGDGCGGDPCGTLLSNGTCAHPCDCATGGTTSTCQGGFPCICSGTPSAEGRCLCYEFGGLITPPCTTDQDCPSGTHCLSDVAHCTAVPCSSTAQCPAGTACFNGFCYRLC